MIPREKMFAKEYRLLSFVPRWGIAPRLTQQSVAEHCFFVALYSSQLCDLLDLEPATKNTIVGYALRHDAYEVWTSDLPGPGKRYVLDDVKMEAYIKLFAAQVPDYGRYQTSFSSARELGQRIIKAADLLDEVYYLTLEHSMGNTLVRDILMHSKGRLMRKLAEFGNLGRDLQDAVEVEQDRLIREGARIPAMDEPPAAMADHSTMSP